MRSLFEQLSVFLVSDQWPVSRVGDSNTLTTRYRGNHGEWTCIGQTLEENRVLLFYSTYPDDIPEEAYGEIILYLALANYGMLNGAFEFDPSDGDLRFRTNLNMPDADPSQETIRRIVYDNVLSMDTYFRGFQGIIAGKLSAEDAIDQMEQQVPRVDT